MDLINNLSLGFNVALTMSNLLYCFAGVLLGTLIGVLPGLGPVATISMLLPLTYALGPIPSIIMLAGIYYGSQYGGSTTSILLNTPGEVSSVMTCVDGNKLTQQGKGGSAIVIAGLSSFIAGCIATVLIGTMSPPLSELAFKLGPAEYCLIIVLGFVSVGILTTGDMIKGVSMALVGILLGLIGTDINTGLERFSFNVPDLLDGVGFATVAVGVFGIAEIIKNVSSKEETKLFQGKISLIPSKEDLIRMLPSSIRGSFVGVFFGLVPGGGAAMSSYAAYAIDKKVSKYKDEFGKGAIEGVAAPEAANNAAAQSGFIPLLSLGIPENAVMALMLGALYLTGVQPGPGIVDKQPELFWGLIASMFIGNALLIILNVPLVRIWIQLIKIPYHLLYPAILAVCCIGVYSINNNPNDVLLVAIFGMLGYLFVVLDLEPAPLMLGLILGPMFEEYFRRTLAISQGSFSVFIERPISQVLLVILSFVVIFGIIRLFKKKRT